MKRGDRVRVVGGAYDGKLATIVTLNGSCAMCRFFSPVQRRSGTWSEQTWVAKRQLAPLLSPRVSLPPANPVEQQ